MLSFSPRKIDALSNGIKYLASIGNTATACINGMIGNYTIDEINANRPMVYVNPGYVLYNIYDKEKVQSIIESFKQKSSDYVALEEMTQMMTADDVIAVVNKKPELRIIFPKSVLPKRFQNAIAIKSICGNIDELVKLYPELDRNTAFNLVLSILNGDKTKESDKLLKLLQNK